ncbi:NAD(+)/NADH kinase, partial [Bacteroidota bacterium]
KLLQPFNERLSNEGINDEYLDHSDLFQLCDVIISIGGDGTMLSTAYEARRFQTPLIGINFGKLGFLAEFELKGVDDLVNDLKNGDYNIEERIALEAKSQGKNKENLFAINDIVIDKGGWPKMIEITIKVDDDYVSTFSADGIIVATPTGSTGYSLSTGGAIISPKADAIAISPISPHTLTMRPLVLSSNQKIHIRVLSQHKNVQINCDGQRVFNYRPPLEVEINKSPIPIKLIHTKHTSYYQILRKKLFWGLDLRTNPNR